ncbi:phosphatidylserine decarboxylase-domain-containing protein [Phycomyces nitens]|nr:phosphatidylserine decarboxylase-domain-containing protein [Phycomyces nitens]
MLTPEYFDADQNAQVEQHIKDNDTEGLGKQSIEQSKEISLPEHWYSRKLTGWIHTHLLPKSFKTAVEKRYGVFLIIRKTGEYHYEEMPMYTRIGMHMLFAGYYRGKCNPMVETETMKKLFLIETIRQGVYFTDPKSVSQIPSFVEHYGINMNEYVKPALDAYSSFNDFFTRAIRPSVRPIASPEDSSIFVSAADSRLGVFSSVETATEFWIKGRKFTLHNFLQDAELANELEGGSMAIFRLAPQDYHRWHAPADGEIESIQTIEGTYYTVNPCVVKEDVNVFTENHRQVLKFKHPEGFNYAVVPIGALLVGSIVLSENTAVGKSLKKGDEMGYFQYGGSTVAVIFPKNSVKWDSDLLKASESSLETKVDMGEHIGRLNKGCL